MSPAPTTTGYALLGLLHVRPWTTYELAKQVQRSLHWFWPRAERKLYDEPKRLVAAGLASATRERTGKRPRTVYALTGDGAAALSAWLSEPAAPRSVEDESMLKVFFADAGSRAQLLATLGRVVDEALARVDELTALAATPAEELPFPARAHLSAITLSLVLEQEITLLRWARWARDVVATWNATDDPGAWDAGRCLDELTARARAEAAGG